MKLFDGPLATLEHSLDIRARRHEVLSSNLANIDTPGWQAKDIDFDSAMQQAQQADRMAASSGSFVGDAGYSGEAAILSPMGANMEPIAMGGDGAFGGDVVDADNLSSMSLDGNSVDLDRTMAALAENGLQYGASARMASKHLAMLRTVINDGNG